MKSHNRKVASNDFAHDYMSNLPTDTLLFIITHVSPRGVVNMRLLCKSVNSIIHEPCPTYVYVRGRNTYSQLGDKDIVNSSGSFHHKVHMLRGLVGIKKVSAGKYHTLFLQDYGFVYSCGSGDHGQLGLFHRDDFTDMPDATTQEKPRIITALETFRITAIAAGECHSLCVDKEGRVHAFGDNTNKQISYDIDDVSCPMPVLLSLPEGHILGAAAGSRHSVAYNGEKVYTWGDGESVQEVVGIEDKPVLEVRASSTHTTIRTENGLLYTAGRFITELRAKSLCGHFGLEHLGRSDTRYLSLHKAGRVTCIEDPIANVCPGFMFNLAVTEADKVMSFGGCKELMRFNLGGPITKITKVACGMHHAAVAYESGKVMLWCPGSSGSEVGHHKVKRGECDESSWKLVYGLLPGSRVVDVACGTWHTVIVAIVEEGNLLEDEDDPTQGLFSEDDLTEDFPLSSE